MNQTIEEKIKLFQEASKAFKNNENISKKLSNSGAAKSTSIEMSYELQAGEYTRSFNDLALKRNKQIHSIIDKYIKLGEVNSVGVFGIGEAKNWIGYEGGIKNLYGVELSFSRLQFAYNNLKKLPGIESINLLKGDASQKVFQNNSFDMTITLHSIEPNGNKQGKMMAQNVMHSSSKYTLFFEPDFSTASEQMKERMVFHDYVKNLEETITNNDSFLVREKFIMDCQETENNLTTCWVLERKVKKDSSLGFSCPFTGCSLKKYRNFLYSPEAGVAFPWIGNWWSLNRSDAIFIGFAEQSL